MMIYVDVIVESKDRELVLIKRKEPPYGWALPGGIVSAGENPIQAAAREVFEETNLEVQITQQFQTYPFLQSDGSCTGLTVVYLAKIMGGSIRGGDDALAAQYFRMRSLPKLIPAHEAILAAFREYRLSRKLPDGLTTLAASRSKSASILAVNQ